VAAGARGVTHPGQLPLGRTIVHVLARAEAAGSASSVAKSQEFVSSWMCRVIATEPSLLETQDTNGLR